MHNDVWSDICVQSSGTCLLHYGWLIIINCRSQLKYQECENNKNTCTETFYKLLECVLRLPNYDKNFHSSFICIWSVKKDITQAGNMFSILPEHNFLEFFQVIITFLKICKQYGCSANLRQFDQNYFSLMAAYRKSVMIYLHWFHIVYKYFILKLKKKRLTKPHLLIKMLNAHR